MQEITVPLYSPFSNLSNSGEDLHINLNHLRQLAGIEIGEGTPNDEYVFSFDELCEGINFGDSFSFDELCEGINFGDSPRAEIVKQEQLGSGSISFIEHFNELYQKHVEIEKRIEFQPKAPLNTINEIMYSPVKKRR